MWHHWRLPSIVGTFSWNVPAEEVDAVFNKVAFSYTTQCIVMSWSHCSRSHKAQALRPQNRWYLSARNCVKATLFLELYKFSHPGSTVSRRTILIFAQVKNKTAFCPPGRFRKRNGKIRSRFPWLSVKTSLLTLTYKQGSPCLCHSLWNLVFRVLEDWVEIRGGKRIFSVYTPWLLNSFLPLPS